MSWPKAVIKHNNATRTATVWACRPRTKVVAIELYHHGDGYKSEIISEDDIISINWECSRKFPNLQQREHIQIYFDGYGADVKQRLYEEEKNKKK